MSKATFYEHFANKEECILALFDEAATEVMRAMADASDAEGHDSYEERVAAGVHAFLETLASYPTSAQTLLVQIIGAGPRAAARRDAILEAFADSLYRDNQRAAPQYGAPTFASRDDAFAIIGALGRARVAQPAHAAPAGRARARAGDHPADAGRAPARVSADLARIEQDVVACRRCPRLVAWREQVAREKRASFAGEEYWGRPVPGFGDPAARVLVLGLAPAAHGGNRTGPRLHRRPLGRLAVRRPAPRGLRQPADVGEPRRRPAAARRLGLGGGALRPAGQQADARGARRVPARGRSPSSSSSPTCA